MKYAIIIPDGAPEEPLEALDGRTPLQAASLPALDSLALRGRLGTTSTAAGGDFPTQAAAHLAVLGYAPERYQVGEGALTAFARGFDVGAEDQVLCCNLVTVIDDVLRDPTAGFISPTEATRLIELLNHAFGGDGFRFRACNGYRNVCIWENGGAPGKLRTTPPERVLNQLAKRHMPVGSDSRPLYALMLRAEALLRDDDVNVVRRDLGENPATAIWLWGQGPLPVLPSFHKLYGIRGGLVAGSDVVRGIGRLVGWEVLDAPGAAALPETDYASKGRTAVAAVDSLDLVCVHVQAPQMFGMLGNSSGKINALEAIDREIVAPLVERLEQEPAWRMLVIPPRPSGVGQGRDLEAHTVFVLAGSGIDSNRGEAFDEENAAAGELHPDRAHDLMEYFLRR